MNPKKHSIIWGSLIILLGLGIAHFGDLWMTLALSFSFALAWFNTPGDLKEKFINWLILALTFFALLLLFGWLSYFPIHNRIVQAAGLGSMAFAFYFVAAYRIKSIRLEPKYMLLVFTLSALSYYLSFYLSAAVFDSSSVPLRSAKRESLQMALILLSVNFGVSLAIQEEAHV
tara:strand:+ start:82056 stop:82574 length:519 start_codon:yes stop_codon:yes gene_type:complete